MQKIRRALRMGGGGEDRALVILQDFQPALNIGCMIAAGLGLQFQIGAKERRAKFGDKFFFGVAFITPFLAPEFTVKTALMLRPVGVMPMSA